MRRRTRDGQTKQWRVQRAISVAFAILFLGVPAFLLILKSKPFAFPMWVFYIVAREELLWYAYAAIIVGAIIFTVVSTFSDSEPDDSLGMLDPRRPNAPLMFAALAILVVAWILGYAR